MAAAARRFRIESMIEARPGGGAGAGGHAEILAAIADLKSSMGCSPELPELVADYQRQIAEVRALKDELDSIQDAILRTKHELAALRLGDHGRDIHRLTDELDAVVSGTEQATETVLQAAETIDRDAADLAAALKKGPNIALVADIRDQVVGIFEACNFQDLTGQRITKVVTTLGFIEERVERMMRIWMAFEHAEAENGQAAAPANLLAGPALEGDPGHVSQSDIDALFD